MARRLLSVIGVTVLVTFLTPPRGFPQGNITTVAGTTWTFTGSGGPATSAPLGYVRGVATDAAGNLYVADPSNNVVVKITPGGTLTIVAGTGASLGAFSGDGGPATSARLSFPSGVALDTAGNIYIADSSNNRIRVVCAAANVSIAGVSCGTVAGNIITIAGTGTASFSGDGGAATSATMNFPQGLTIHANLHLYIADTNNHRIRVVDLGTGTINTRAGNGTAGSAGDGAAATLANLNSPQDVTVDANDVLYIADNNNNRIRKVDTAGIITAIAGTGSSTFSGDNGPATSAGLANPRGVALDSAGNLYIATNNQRIRRVVPGADNVFTGAADELITTVAGNGTFDFSGDGAAATSATLRSPFGIAFDTSGNLYIADNANNRVRKVVPGADTQITGATDELISTFAGNGLFKFGSDGAAPTSTFLASTQSVAVDSAGNLYIVEFDRHRVRKITSGGTVSTLVGTGGFPGFSGDGVAAGAANALLSFPRGVAVDTAGNVYIADRSNDRIRKVTVATGIITTVAGGAGRGIAGDGSLATSAQLNQPLGLAADAAGNLFIADTSNNRIRLVCAAASVTILGVNCTAAGNIFTVAGTGTAGFAGDGLAATAAQLNAPNAVALDSLGNLYIADRTNGRIRKVDTAGVITTIAGTGSNSTSGDGGLAINAAINRPEGVLVDGANPPNIYVADTSSSRIRKILPSGKIFTIAGTGTFGFGGDGGPATSALLTNARGMALDSSSNLYIADQQNDRVRRMPTGPISFGLPASLNFTLLSGQTATQAVSIPSTVSGAISWTATYATTSGGAWLSGTASGSTPGTISLTANAGVLSAATYQGTVTIQASPADAGIQNATINVTLVVQAPPVPPGPAINTAAGSNWVFAYPANGAATSAALGPLRGVAFDAAGNVYSADTGNHIVVKVSSSGALTVVAGRGVSGSDGDGGLAINARLSSPQGVAVDTAGNVYISDTSNNRIRKVTVATGIISTIAGTGTAGFGGDGGTATNALLNSPLGIAVDGAGNNVYVADSNNNRIRKISGGNISTVAGTGTASFSGDGALAINATLSSPRGVALDATGNLFIADRSNRRVRKVDTAGNITTVAGTGSNSFSGDGGQATSASLSNPEGVSVDGSGNLYIADTGNARIRKVDTTGTINTIAGSAGFGFTGDAGLATSAQLTNPNAAAVDGSGNLYIADTDNFRLRKVVAGNINTIAGNGLFKFLGDGGQASAANLNNTFGGALDASGNLFIADTNNHRIRKVTAAGIITTVAGNGIAGFSGDGSAATSARLGFPRGVAVDSSGNLYIADTSNNRVRKVTSGGTISTLAGTGTAGFSGDTGPALSANLNFPTSVAVDTSGNVYIADTNNNRIRKVTSGGTISTFAGTGTAGFSGDGVVGGAISANLNAPQGVAVDGAGNVYIADTSNNRIRKVDTAGTITTVAGTGVAGFASDGVAATSALLNGPLGVAVDGAGNLYIADTGNFRVRKVTALTGIITTLSGSGSNSVSGDSGLAALGSLNNPRGVAVDAAGNNVYVTGGDRTRQISLGPNTFSVPANISFTLFVDSIGAQAIPISSAFAGLPWTASFATTSGGSWLGGQGTGTAPGTIFIIAGLPGLTPGTYQGTVTVTAPLSATAPQTVAVTLTVLAAPTPPGLVINTIAGSAWVFPPAANGGSATNAPLGFVNGVATDSSGNVFIADPPNHLVFKVTPGGTLTIVAGTGSCGFSGDTGPATSAALCNPNGVAVDGSGNLYIADTWNHRIRKVNASDGKISTVAGNGNYGFSGDGVPGGATSAQLAGPFGVAVHAGIHLYIADLNNSRIRMVELASGTISTVAGNGGFGFSGEGGPATGATLNFPQGVSVDASDNVYIADTNNNRIRKFTTGGTITTVAGTGSSGSSGDSGPATSATLSVPGGVWVDAAGSFFLIADSNNNRIRKVVNSTGTITTIAGTGSGGFSGDGGLATSAIVQNPQGVAVDATGNLYIAEQGNQRIRKVNTAGTISTFAGNGLFKFGGDSGPATSAFLSYPRRMAVDPSGNLYIAESNNRRIRKVSSTGTITTVAGNGLGGFSGDGGPATSAALGGVRDVARDAAGNLYIAAGNNRIRKVDTAGNITTVAGSGTSGFTGDGGLATIARISNPQGVAVDTAGNLYIADTNNSRIRKVTAATGIITTFAGNGNFGFSGDGGPATNATLNSPQGVALDPLFPTSGNLYIADSNNNRIRKVDAAGTITTVAGTGVYGDTGDGGPATSATLVSPHGVAVDSTGNLYLTADTFPNRVRKVSTSGVITTVAGNGFFTFSGDGGLAALAAVGGPEGVAVDGSGNLLIADSNNDRIRKVFTLTGAPTVTINQAQGQADPATTSPVNFTVIFGEAVTGFTTGDVTLSGTAGATTATVTSVNNSATTYNVAVSGMTGSGTVIATIAANVATGTVTGLGNQASTSTDNTVTFLVSADLTVSAADSPDPVASGGTLTYTVTVSNVGNSTADNVTLNATLPAGLTSVTCTPSVANCASFALGNLAALANAVVTITGTAPTVTSPTFIRAGFAASTTSAELSTLNNGAAATTTVGTIPSLVVGGPPASNILAIAIDPRSTDTVYVAPLGGGVFKSSNGGVNWTAVNNPITVPSIQALAIDPTNPAIIYRGEGRSDGGRVARSANGGATWTVPSTGLTATGSNVYALAVDPASPATIYAGTSLTDPGTIHGVFKSIDGGVTWTVTGLTSQVGDVRALVTDPTTNPTTVYAGAFGGVFKSTDGGVNWTALLTGLTNVNVQALVLDRANPGTFYAGTGGGGVFKTTDGGLNWSLFSTGLTNLDVRVLAIDPSNSLTVYAGGSGGVFKSGNGGSSWVAANSGLTQPNVNGNALAIDPANPGILYAGTPAAGLFKTINGAGNWTAINSGLPTSAINTHSLTIVPNNPATVYVGRNNGGVNRTTNGGRSWTITAFSGTTSAVAIDPVTPTTIYQGRSGQGIIKSTDGGTTVGAINNGITNVTTLSVFALAIHPFTPTTIYAGTAFGSGSGVFKTTDGGTTWVAMNNGITDVGGVVGRGVASLAIDPVNPNTVYAGGFGGLFKTTDGGANWTTITNGLPSLGQQFGNAHVRALAINPRAPRELYAGIWNNPGVGTPGVFKSTDGGANWTAVNNGLTIPFSQFARALAIDPANPSTIYLGTPAGVFKSTDSAANWTAANNGFPDIGGGLGRDVESLVIDPVTPTTLYAGTFGFGVFRSTDGAATWQPTGLSLGSGAGPATTIAKVSGDNQTRGVGQALRAPFVTVVTNASGEPVPGVTVDFAITAGGGSLSAGSGVVTDAQGVASTLLTLGANAGTNTVTATSTGLANSPLTFNATAVGPPVINAGGIVNGAHFGAQPIGPRALAPGSFDALFGNNLASGTTFAGSTPLPTLLGGVSVTFNGTAVPLGFVGPGQINLQVPWELAGQTQATVIVTRDGLASASQVVALASYDPGLFSASANGSGAGQILHGATGLLVTTANPAAPGEVVSLFGTGWGPVTNQPATGSPGLGNPLSATTTTPTVTIGGASATVLFSGLAPGFVGFNQANVTVPANATPGDAVPVVLTIGSLSSNTVTIAIAAGPTVTINQAQGQADPTNASPINFTVVFSEAVTGFVTGDVTLSGTAGATTATVTGSGTTYNVAVSGMTQSGTVIATIPANAATGSTSGLGNAASTSTDNQVTFDNVAPTVTINQAQGQADPATTSPINFTVVFSEPVTGFTGSDVTLSGTAGATSAVVTGGPSTYNVAVSGMTTANSTATVIATVPANAATDLAGNGNLASTSTDNQVIFTGSGGGGGSGAVSGTLSAASAGGAPGSTVNIPISLALNQGVTADSLSFGLQIFQNGNAPALSGILTFTKASALPAPAFIDPLDPATFPSDQIAVAWLSGLTLSGSNTSLGTVQVVIPISATNAQTYTIRVTGATATSGPTTNVPLGLGPDVTLTVGATYLVGDVFPLLTDLNGDGDRDDAGEFGDGILNNLDLIQALRAVVNLSRPPGCSDRFDAMDAFTLDTTTRGGDQLLDNRDLIRTLRRVVNLDTSRPVRVTRGISPCPIPARAPAPAITLLSQQRSESMGSPVAEGALKLGAAEPTATGIRVPVYLRTNSDSALMGLSLGLGVSGLTAGPLHFIPGQTPPTLVDSGMPGAVALAWLEGLRAQAGQDFLLGYAEITGTDESGAVPLNVYGVAANAQPDGRNVRIAIPVEASPPSSNRRE